MSSYARAILAPAAIEQAIPSLNGRRLAVNELFSSSLNDIYLSRCGTYVKIYNDDFVDPDVVNEVYSLLLRNRDQSGPICLPLQADNHDLPVFSFPYDGRHFTGSFFPFAGAKRLEFGDSNIASRTQERLQLQLNAEGNLLSAARRLDISTEIQELKAEARKWAGTIAEPTVSQIISCISQFDAIIPVLSDAMYLIQHGDFHNQNILVDGSKVSIIDLDFCRWAPAGYDIATFAWAEARRVFSSTESIDRQDIRRIFGGIRTAVGQSEDYWISVMVLRHIFFLKIQLKLWKNRGSSYALDERTLREIRFLIKMKDVVGQLF
jgi:Ser/Thr protein kinase RdoA (MazF antagonist)